MMGKLDIAYCEEDVTSRSGAEERSDESPKRGAKSAAAADPEVLAKPKRRQFSAAYRLRILEEADGCRSPGEIGRLLRREGLYSSHLANWRKARHNGALAGLAPKKRGAKPTKRNPLQPKVQALETQVAYLQGELRKARIIMEVQGKVAGLLEINLNNGNDS